MMIITVNISKKQLELAENVAISLQNAIGNKEPWTSLNSYLNPVSRLNYIAQVEYAVNIKLQDKKILEVGSGMGMFTVVANKIGLNIVGIEPCANSYGVLNSAIDELLMQNGLPTSTILRESGESLPWADATFDIVVAFQVLEHVANPKQTLQECIRVLKPGGKLFMDMPNYFSFVEAHYGIIWNPIFALSKKIARIYVKLNSRNVDFLKELNFVTPWRLRRWLKNTNTTFSILPPPDHTSITTTVKDIQVRQQLPQDYIFPTGQRFSPFGILVRRIINIPKIKHVLYLLGMADHIILVAEKK